jgi:predicted Fe-Mo cluster-binding NifX family protein
MLRRNAMKIAIPVWNNCVSNVFDFAHRLLLVEIENNKEVNRSEIPLEVHSLPQRAGQLKSLGVDVLVCGAISRALAYMVTASGIEVLAFVTGRVDDVLGAYLTGQLAKPQFIMPGYWPGARKGFGRGERRCRWRGARR